MYMQSFGNVSVMAKHIWTLNASSFTFQCFSKAYNTYVWQGLSGGSMELLCKLGLELCLFR